MKIEEYQEKFISNISEVIFNEGGLSLIINEGEISLRVNGEEFMPDSPLENKNALAFRCAKAFKKFMARNPRRVFCCMAAVEDEGWISRKGEDSHSYRERAYFSFGFEEVSLDDGFLLIYQS